MLFTDLVGSTELRVRVGEDAADALRRAHDTLLSEAVAAHGGTVVKGLGDGIMATFESAADAVAGAVAVQQAAEAHSRRVPEQAFGVRVGASIGDVSTEDGDVYGVPVVEASRLCAMAAGGEILAADVVRALARGRGDFVFEPMGELALKGLPDPVIACRVIWHPIIERAVDAHRTPVPIAAPLLGAATAYVGREQLRDRLAEAWRAATAGACHTVLLAGEPGVGKTRTAAELARSAFAEGAVVLYGRCDEELAVPYQPFVEALEHYARHSDEPELGRLRGELTRLVPDLGTHVAGLPPAVTSDPASEEYRLFEATASWLVDTARAAAAGLILVLDDIHWATKPTLQLMQHLVRNASDEHAPLLVLATYRDTDIDRTHPLSAILGDLRRLPGVDRVAVDNLSNAEVIAFIATAAGHELDDDVRHLADAIYAETEGNPFFVGEVLRHLIETGGVRREGERWVVAEPDHVTVPEGVRDVVGRRLNRLPSTANDVLSVAAVLGRDFDIDPLLAVVDVAEAATLDALDLAVRARLVEETGVDRYRFAHALVRTTLYEELSATRRRRLHRRVADVLEKLRPDDVRALAHHCTEAGGDGGDPSRALRYTLAAAEQSLAARAFADAEAGFRGALELLDDSRQAAPVEFVAAMCGLGESQRDQGNPAFRETLLEASARAFELRNLPLLQRSVLANTRGFASNVGGIDSERLHLIERAVELVGETPSADRARLLGQLASELTFSGEHERRLALSDEAEAMARDLGDDTLLCDVLVATAFACGCAERWQRLVQRSGEAVQLADARADPTLRVLARIYYSSALLTAGELEESERVTHEMVAIAESDTGPLIRWTVRSLATRLPILAGRLDEAEALNNASLALAGDLGQNDGQLWWASTLVGLMWLRGYAGNLADPTAELADQFPLAMSWRCAQAWLLADAGRFDESGAVIHDHALDPVQLNADPWPFTEPFQLIIAAWLLDDAELAALGVAALAPYRECWVHYNLFVMGPVTWALGLAHATTGAHDEAIAELDAALAEVSRHGFVAYAPVIQLHLAQVLRRRDATGDHERAAALLASACDAAAQLGSGGIVDRIDALR